MKQIAKQYLENVYRSITESTSAKYPSYGLFIQMLKSAIVADGGKIVGDIFFTVETKSFIIDSDEIYKWFTKK